MSLAQVADHLDAVHREGAAVDEPEGARFLTMSDTLARQLSAALRDAARLEDRVIR